MVFDLADWITNNTTLGDAWLASSVLAVDGSKVLSLGGAASRFSLAESGANCPAIQTVSGKRYLDCANQWLVADGVASDWAFMHRSDRTFYGIIAFRVDAGAGNVQMPLLCTGANAQGIIGFSSLWDNSSLTKSFRYHVTNGSSATAITGAANEGPVDADILLEIVFPGNNFSRTLNLNGSGVTETVAAVNAPVANLTVGSNSNNSLKFSGRIYGVMAVDALPSERDRKAIQRAFLRLMPAPTVMMHQYAGTVTDKSGSPATRDCILIRDSTNMIVDATQSEADGRYELFSQFDEEHTLLFKGESNRNALVYTGVQTG